MDLQVTARPAGDSTVVEVHGDLDMATAPAFRQGLQARLDAGDRRVVVDLSGVGFMDSSALGALVTVFKAMRDAGGELSVAAPQPAVRSVLRITSVDRAVDVHDSVDAAVTAGH